MCVWRFYVLELWGELLVEDDVDVVVFVVCL